MIRNNDGTWTLADWEMNNISIACTEAAISFEKSGHMGLEGYYNYLSQQIYNGLKINGFYDHAEVVG